MTDRETELLSTPLGFAKGVLQLDCYAWLEKILYDLDTPGQISCRAANGVGKSSRIGATAAMWNASVHPGSLTLVSGAVYRQVVEIFQTLRSYKNRFPGCEFLQDEIRFSNGSRIIGFVAEKAELFEGFHNRHLMIILDEAKAIDDSIYQAALRCQPERLILLSSPGPRSGFFYESQTGKRKFFRCHGISAFDAPHVPRKWIDDIIEQFGETHPYTRSAVYGEFSDYESDAVIPLSFVESCLANPPAVSSGETSAFCDFAGNSAENVLSIARGNSVTIDAWKESDTARSVGRFLKLFKERNLLPHQVRGDADGLGVVYCDLFAENGWPINKFHGGKPAQNSQVYGNAIAEAWYMTRRRLEKKEIIIPNDPVLIGQLTSRKGWCNSKGLLVLESKEDLQKRGIPSPDRADGFVGCLLGANFGSTAITDVSKISYGNQSQLGRINGWQPRQYIPTRAAAAFDNRPPEQKLQAIADAHKSRFG